MAQLDPDLLASITRASNEIYERTIRSRANWIRVEEGSELHRALDPSVVDLLGDLTRSQEVPNSQPPSRRRTRSAVTP